MNGVDHPIDAKVVGALPVGEFSPPAAGGRKWPIRYHSVEAATIIFDLATITWASLCASILYQAYEGKSVDLGQPLGSATLISALFSLFLKCNGLYSPMELLIWRRQVQLVFATWTGVFLLLAGIVFALKIGSELSRGTNMLFAALGLVALFVNRVIVRGLLAKGLAERRFSGREVVLIIDRKHREPALERMLAAVGLDVTAKLVLPSPGQHGRIKGLTANLIEQIRGSDIEEVIVAASPNRWTELRILAAELRLLPFPVTFVPIGSTVEMLRRPLRDLGGTMCMELQRGPLSGVEHAAKRCVDVIGASLILIGTFPLLALVAVAIRLDSPGPILFRQQRLGFNGRSFLIYKFRTMTVLEDGLSAVQARAADDRVTRVGKWLRRTSLDELPQLLNVLNGTMSLVGPRPHVVALDNQFDKLVRNYGFRQRVKPGLTGWAQIHGYRGPTPTADLMRRRVEHDVWYIDNWSLRLDIAILLQTPIEVLRGRNAY
jgi:putative colanic acid biosynthesis UDP-glucose lipid carrier transferase